MIYNPNDKLDFGKYRSVQTGLVYLLAPSYIKWAIRDNPSFCLGQVEFLSSLKVIDLFGKSSWEAHEVEVDIQEVKENWAKVVDFEDIKFSGYKHYRLPDDILETNAKKLPSNSPSLKRKIIPEEDRHIFIFYPGEFYVSKETNFTPTAFLSDTKNGSTLGFIVDNSNGVINFLPKESKLKVSSFYLSDWEIEEDEIEKHIEESKPFLGRIENGFLILS